jgi:hypothetical protein
MNEKYICDECKGTGKITRYSGWISGGGRLIDCNKCYGKGELNRRPDPTPQEIREQYDKVNALLTIHKGMKLPYRSFCHFDFIAAVDAVMNNERIAWDRLPKTTLFKRRVIKNKIQV